MKFKSISIPSVLDSHNSHFSKVTSNKYDGLKIRHDGEEYIIGRLAMLEGLSPHKVINCAPAEIDYQLLMKAALLITSDFTEGKKLNITTGFPFSTNKMNQDHTRKFIKEQSKIITYGQPYGKDEEIETSVDIESVQVIPELAASTIAVRSGEMNMKGGVLVISLGYGTLEMGMSIDSGFIQRTFNAGSGLRYAIRSSMEKLQRDYYLGMRNEHQFDESFKKGVITLNKRKIDLTEIRKAALQEYYKNVISPLIQYSWTDDFSKANTLVLVGGGALCNDLVNSFYEEFNGILNMEIPDDPLIMASIGYALHSKNVQSEESDAVPVGIDIGNANTVTSILVSKEECGERSEKSQDKFYAELVENNIKI